MSNFRYVDREYIHPCIAGSMYGGKPFLLARTNELILVWIPGYTSYTGRAAPNNSYSASQMISHRRAESGWRGIKPIWKHGGRLKAALADSRCRQAIDARFGSGFHQLIEIDRTLVVGDNEPWKGDEDDPRHKLGYGHRSSSDDLVEALRERKS